MVLQIYTDGKSYYTQVRGMGATDSLHWAREDDRWVASKQQLPGGLQEAALSQAPAELQEELFAFATRAQAIGTSNWDFKN